MAAGIEIKFSSDIDRTKRRLQAWARKMPRVERDTINDVAFGVRKNTVDVVYPASFTMRKPQFPGAAFRVGKAKTSRLSARVYDRFGVRWLWLQAVGGTKRPTGGARNLTIPTARVRRGKAGGVPKGQRPRAILDKPGYFIVRRGGLALIMRRLRRGLRVLYTLHPQAEIPQRFPFHAEADRLAKASLTRAFRRRLNRMIKNER